MNSMNNASTALLYSAQEPTAAQRKRFADFLARTYPGQALTLEWKEDASLAGGFRLEVGPDIYDWSLQGRMQQLRQRIEALDNSDNVLPLMRQTIEDWAPSTKPEEMGTVLTVFRRPYLNVVKVRFLVWLKITLGSLLVIPGIYWSYCYYMVPYLLAENPYMTTSRAMELSRQMMYGEKWHTFVLELSFLGWLFLCALTLGIGLVFLEPYYQATFAELYAALRAKAFANGMTDQNELAGFVRHDGGEYFA